MVRKIVTELSELLQPCSDIPENQPEIAETIIQDLLDTARATPNCAGLAANQIGCKKKAFVIATGNGYLPVVNPLILSKSGQVMGNERCLSRPGVTARVIRPTKVTAVFCGKTMEFKGELAVRFMHEYDHLMGRVIGITKHEKAA